VRFAAGAGDASYFWALSPGWPRGGGMDGTLPRAVSGRPRSLPPLRRAAAPPCGAWPGRDDGA